MTQTVPKRRSRWLRPLLTTALLSVAALLCVATSVDEPPRISEVTPTSDAVDVAVDAPVVIQLSVAVDEQTVTADSVQLRDPDGFPVPVALSVDDSWEIVLTPETPLAPDTTYLVVLELDLLRSIHDEAYDAAEEALELDYDPDNNTISYSFTTALAPR